MNYTLHQLQIFVEVVRQGSVTKAAEAMHMTQPALSIQLKSFQQQFKAPLTEMSGRQLHITDFGYEIAHRAQNVINETEAIKFKTKAYEGLLTGRLRISSASTGKYVIPYFLSGFLNEHSGIDLVLDVTNKSRVIESLKANEIDFALVSTVPEGLEVEGEPLLENQLYLISNQPKAQYKKPYLLREAGSATRKAMDSFLGKKLGRKRIELTSNEAVKQAVMAGIGYSIVPIIGIKNELASKELYIIPTRGLPITTTWRLIWLKNKTLSPLAKAYLAYVRENKQAIIQENFGWYQQKEF